MTLRAPAAHRESLSNSIGFYIQTCSLGSFINGSSCRHSLGRSLHWLAFTSTAERVFTPKSLPFPKKAHLICISNKKWISCILPPIFYLQNFFIHKITYSEQHFTLHFFRIFHLTVVLPEIWNILEIQKMKICSEVSYGENEFPVEMCISQLITEILSFFLFY